MRSRKATRTNTEPYHGYYFKILKGQGPAAPMGQMDFVVDSAMIGGFALVAAPAEYLVTGVKTFIVSHDGIVYEKDLGERTLEAFRGDGALQSRLHLEGGPRALSSGPRLRAHRCLTREPRGVPPGAHACGLTGLAAQVERVSEGQQWRSGCGLNHGAGTFWWRPVGYAKSPVIQDRQTAQPDRAVVEAELSTVVRDLPLPIYTRVTG